MVDLVRSYGYNAEEVLVVTTDGYILSLTHIKSTSTKLPVLMMHGFIGMADQWLQLGPRKDLGHNKTDTSTHCSRVKHIPKYNHIEMTLADKAHSVYFKNV